MKRWIAVSGIFGALLLGGIVTTTAAGAKQETKYYLGKGDTKGSGLRFIVRNGAVRETLTDTGPLQCGGRRVSVFKSFGAAELHGTKFRRKAIRPEESKDKFLVAGHVRGDAASGRLRSILGDECNSGTIHWEAKRVSRKQYRKHCHCIKPRQ